MSVQPVTTGFLGYSYVDTFQTYSFNEATTSAITKSTNGSVTTFSCSDTGTA